MKYGELRTDNITFYLKTEDMLIEYTQKYNKTI